jgi:hypothetical protein
MPNHLLDFQALQRQMLPHLTTIIPQLLPDGRMRGCEYIARNPKRSDRRLGSFKVNIRTGRWCDFATGDAGGDIISLIAYVQRIGQADAARLVQEMVGGGHV